MGGRILEISGDEGARSRGSYHHGDLSRALVAAAAEILAELGEVGLTLREVGQRVGVSRTALYRHYSDKAALLEAVALEGFRTVRREIEAALRREMGPHSEPLTRLAEAYLDFGATHPAHYRTMFGPTLKGHDRNPDLRAEGAAAFRVLVDVILQGQMAGRMAPGDPVRIAQVVWSTLHGIVTLGGDGQFGPGSPASESGAKLLPLAMSVMLSGLMIRDGMVEPLDRDRGATGR